MQQLSRISRCNYTLLSVCQSSHKYAFKCLSLDPSEGDRGFATRPAYTYPRGTAHTSPFEGFPLPWRCICTPQIDRGTTQTPAANRSAHHPPQPPYAYVRLAVSVPPSWGSTVHVRVRNTHAAGRAPGGELPYIGTQGVFDDGLHAPTCPCST
jgi:hypothetical protein